MRRGLLKDFANTPTQIACGWRLYGDLNGLGAVEGSIVTINLLTGDSAIQGQHVAEPLEIAAETSRWLTDRCERDDVPTGTIISATMTLRPVIDTHGTLVVDCETILETRSGTYASRDTTSWGLAD